VSKEDVKQRLLLSTQEDEKDKNMKAGIKYLRHLGDFRRRGDQKLTSIVEVLSDHNCSNYDLGDPSEQNRLKFKKELSLRDYNDTKSLRDLNAEELDYIDLTKEYRQYDEKRFEAF
jgi:hypothetical protein